MVGVCTPLSTSKSDFRGYSSGKLTDAGDLGSILLFQYFETALVTACCCCFCLHIKPFFLPNDVSSTLSARPDSSSYEYVEGCKLPWLQTETEKMWFHLLDAKSILMHSSFTRYLVCKYRVGMRPSAIAGDHPYFPPYCFWPYCDSSHHLPVRSAR